MSQPKFSSPEELDDTFQRWRSEFTKGGDKENEIPDIEGFCYYIDSYRDLFSEYGNKEAYSDTIKKIKNWIYFKKKQLAMTNKMNPAVFIFDAKNNHNYVDRIDTDLTSNGQTVGVTLNDNQASQLIAARAARKSTNT